MPEHCLAICNYGGCFGFIVEGVVKLSHFQIAITLPKIDEEFKTEGTEVNYPHPLMLNRPVPPGFGPYFLQHIPSNCISTHIIPCEQRYKVHICPFNLVPAGIEYERGPYSSIQKAIVTVDGKQFEFEEIFAFSKKKLINHLLLDLPNVVRLFEKVIHTTLGARLLQIDGKRFHPSQFCSRFDFQKAREKITNWEATPSLETFAFPKGEFPVNAVETEMGCVGFFYQGSLFLGKKISRYVWFNTQKLLVAGDERIMMRIAKKLPLDSPEFERNKNDVHLLCSEVKCNLSKDDSSLPIPTSYVHQDLKTVYLPRFIFRIAKAWRTDSGAVSVRTLGAVWTIGPENDLDSPAVNYIMSIRDTLSAGFPPVRYGGWTNIFPWLRVLPEKTCFRFLDFSYFKYGIMDKNEIIKAKKYEPNSEWFKFKGLLIKISRQSKKEFDTMLEPTCHVREINFLIHEMLFDGELRDLFEESKIKADIITRVCCGETEIFDALLNKIL
jgi:hypothetical protein